MFLRSLFVLAVVPLVLGDGVKFLGMNIAGFEFGCEIDGTCPLDTIAPPLTTLGGSDGVGQMAHFVKDDLMNIFRLPVSWQYLVNDVVGGPLDTKNFGNYDQLMQACLKTGAYCAIDVHNFARFNGKIIGQGGPTDAQFANLWTQLATKYNSTTKAVFGLMNEPHDLDVPTWANSVQIAVTAIRKVGATSQMILLPGTNFASAGYVVSSGSGAALFNVTNPDGSTDGLILDVHKYLDVDNSGTHAECVTDNIADAFAILAPFLRTSKRQAIISETGAGSNPLCTTDFCAQNVFINNNSDVFIGYIAWGAGSLNSSYILSETPTKTGTKWVDTNLASQCVIAPWQNATGINATSSTSSSSSTATSSTTGTATGGGTKTTGTGTGAQTGIVVGTTTATPSKSRADAKAFGGVLLLGSFLLAFMLL